MRSFHSLRHYFCSKLVSCGASIEAVRLLAGHSDLAITQRYVHAQGKELKAAIAKLPGQSWETAPRHVRIEPFFQAFFLLPVGARGFENCTLKKGGQTRATRKLKRISDPTPRLEVT